MSAVNVETSKLCRKAASRLGGIPALATHFGISIRLAGRFVSGVETPNNLVLTELHRITEEN